jgi:hypothetical protein
VTDDVGVLLTFGGLDIFRNAWLGKGYLEKFPGSRRLRDTENNSFIDVVSNGQLSL